MNLGGRVHLQRLYLMQLRRRLHVDLGIFDWLGGERCCNSVFPLFQQNAAQLAEATQGLTRLTNNENKEETLISDNNNENSVGDDVGMALTPTGCRKSDSNSETTTGDDVQVSHRHHTTMGDNN